MKFTAIPLSVGAFAAFSCAEPAFASTTTAEPAVAAQALLACGDDQIRELLLARGSAFESWRWTADAAADLSADWHKRLAHIDDCKMVDDGKAILATSSTGGTVLIERANGHILFRADTPMAHSADLLPGGLIAIALSLHEEGNRLQIYRRDAGDAPLAQMPLHSGHGAVWDAARRLLFVLSYDSIQAIIIHDLGARIDLTVTGQWSLPGRQDGHDLSPRGDGTYLVTTADGVWIFDPRTGGFSPYSRLNPASNVKAVTQSDQTIAWVQTEERWWAYGFSAAPIRGGKAKRYALAGMKLYKVRWENQGLQSQSKAAGTHQQ